MSRFSLMFIGSGRFGTGQAPSLML